MNKLYFAIQNKSKDVVLKSGSGGMFFALSKYVLDRDGVVYGASFTKDFKDVEITRVDKLKKIDKLLTSKYLMSNASKSFSSAKEDLDKDRLVLYSGLPCQIHALKNFLKKDYDNLICAEIVCHGTLPANMWKEYLKSLEDKEIVSVNMRDKRLGWNDYGMSIKFKDDSELFEKHQDNKYMKAFLSDKYLNKSCYDCKFKNEFSKADISIGDFWGATDTNTPFNKKLGINVVVVHTEKGLDILNKLDVNKISLDKSLASKYNGGMSNKIYTQSEQYNRSIFSKEKVAILTLNFNDNIGGVLQSFALQHFLNNNFYDATTIQSHDYWHHLSFVKKLKCRTVTDFTKIKNDYDSYIVGSDQVWRRDFISGKWAECWKSYKPLFLDFAKDWNVKKIAYSTSYGNDNFDFKDVMSNVKDCLNQFDAISMRETDATKYIKELTNKDVITTCDPTMLLNKEDYIELCKDCATKESGLFTYILDKNTEIDKIISNANIKTMSCKSHDVEDWLACYRDCNCVITDSYHGVVFSIIFNKPFICIYNKGRGGSRFNTLIELFNIKDRVVTNIDEVDYKLLEQEPNIDLTKIVKISEEFLLKNLKCKKEIKKKDMKRLKICFGVPSWIPENEPGRTLRKERLDRMFKQITDLFGDVDWLVVAQNWKEYKQPDFVKNIKIRHKPQLGILGARKELRQFFLDENYDYLVMLDDDIILETEPTFNRDYFFNTLNNNSQGFVFLKYGWSLTFCAVSRYIYEREPMCDIDPQKNEGYEDMVWPYLLHYKYSDKEFTLSGIKFVQHVQNDNKAPSTWENASISHNTLDKLSWFYINRFKKGNYIIDKKLASQYMQTVKYIEEARWNQWITKEQAEDMLKKFY